jgi:hypothetical protein
MANRNLLIDVGENVRFEAAFLAANCTITGSGKTLTRSSGVNVQTACRAGLPRKRGKLWFAGVISGSTPGLGIGTSFATNALNVGNDGDSWGVFMSGGQWIPFHNAVNFGAQGACASGDTFVIVCDIQNGNLWIGHYAAGSPGAVTWAGGGDPSAGSSPTYTGMAAQGTLKNNVQRGYYAMATTYNAGDAVTLITDRDGGNATGASLALGSRATPWGEWGYFAADAVVTSPTDSQWSRYYDGRIGPDGDPTYQRSVSFWTFGNRSSLQIPIANIDLLNGDGVLDWMVNLDLRDVVITGWMYTKAVNGQAVLIPDSSTWTKAFTVIGDHVQTPNENTIRLIVADSLARLSTPVQVNTYPTGTPNTSIVGQLKPFCLGFVLFCPFVMFDPANLQFDFCDMPQGPINAIYDQGVTIAVSTGWQGSKNAGVFGITRMTNPAGRQCGQINGQMINSAPQGNTAEPFGAWAGGAPAGFILTIGANCTLTNPSGTIARFQCTANQANHTSTLQTAYVPPATSAWVELVVSAVTSGYIEVVVLPTSNVVNTGAAQAVLHIDAPGTYRIPFSANNVNRAIGIQWGKVICDIQVTGCIGIHREHDRRAQCVDDRNLRQPRGLSRGGNRHRRHDRYTIRRGLHAVLLPAAAECRVQGYFAGRARRVHRRHVAGPEQSASRWADSSTRPA